MKVKCYSKEPLTNGERWVFWLWLIGLWPIKTHFFITQKILGKIDENPSAQHPWESNIPPMIIFDCKIQVCQPHASFRLLKICVNIVLVLVACGWCTDILWLFRTCEEVQFLYFTDKSCKHRNTISFMGDILYIYMNVAKVLRVMLIQQIILRHIKWDTVCYSFQWKKVSLFTCIHCISVRTRTFIDSQRLNCLTEVF